MNVAFASNNVTDDDTCGGGCITDGLYSDPDLLREAIQVNFGLLYVQEVITHPSLQICSGSCSPQYIDIGLYIPLVSILHY